MQGISDIHLSRNPTKEPISRGIPISKALQDETLLAFAMNGKDIPLAHGYPLRLFAGGWTVIYFKAPIETMDKGFNAQKTTEQLNSNPDLIENGIHLRSGLLASEGSMEVVNNCTTCHSAKLVTQNRMDKGQWEATMRWIQETQGLWSLGDKQEVIINYLTTNYPPLHKGRRQALSNIDWYKLEK